MLNLYKNKGETPLQRLDRFRLENPSYKDAILSYAGRLDPMAEGVLLVMEGDENKEREKYLGFDKEYITEILCGFATDTGDVLGLITHRDDHSSITKKDVETFLKDSIGKFVQTYPNYSSKTVGGIPLFDYARKGIDVEVPTKEVQLNEALLLGETFVDGETLRGRISNEIDLVQGDFRQEEIKNKWKEELVPCAGIVFKVFTIRLSVSSGFYVRAFAERLGSVFGSHALALSIKRIRVDKWGIENSLR